MRFSKTTQSFYPEDTEYPNLPSDVVIIPHDEWQLAIARASGETLDFVGGKLVIIPAPALTPAELAQQQRDAIDYQIAQLEQQQLLPRITREALLATAVLMAAQQGITESQLYAAQIGYHKLKDFDTLIAGLRAERDAIK